MKLNLFKTMIVLAAIGCTFINPIQAQNLTEGDVLIEGYIGFPNLYTTLLKNTYIDEVSGTEQNVQVGGMGPLGIRAEYFVTEKFGIGLDMNYSNSFISWDDASSGTKLSYKVSVPRFRAMAKFNFHFVQTDQFDAYSSVGAGYGSLKYKYETTDPNYNNENESFPIPVSFRLAAGARYFFVEHVGINLEFGLFGGALIHAGMSYKL